MFSSWPKILFSVQLKSWLNFQQWSAVSYHLVSAFRSSQQWPLHQNSKRSNRISQERSQTKIISPKRCWKNRPTTLLQTKTNRFSSTKVLWTTQNTQTSSTHPTNCIIHQLTTLPTVQIHSRYNETLHQNQPATLQEL